MIFGVGILWGDFLGDIGFGFAGYVVRLRLTHMGGKG